MARLALEEFPVAVLAVATAASAKQDAHTFLAFEPGQPSQRVGAAGNDRAKNQPVACNAVEDKEWKRFEVAPTEFWNDGRTKIQKVTGAGGRSFDRIYRRINLISESGSQPN